MIVAVVPAKNLLGAKERLSGCLNSDQRQALFVAMLGDVLAALRSALTIDATLVVTREPQLIALAGDFGAEVHTEPANQGHTEAVRLATLALLDRGAHAMLTIPGDVPAVTAAELDSIVAASPPARSAVLVPSSSGQGTNGVLLRPPDAMPLRFGEPSFPNHLEAAQRMNLATRVLHLPGLGLDVDTPDDLARLLSVPCGSRTSTLLADRTMQGVFEAKGIHAY